MNKLMLNLGCGSVRPINWVNTDSSINAHLQRIPLIGKKLASIINNISYDKYDDYIIALKNSKYLCRVINRSQNENLPSSSTCFGCPVLLVLFQGQQ